MAESDSGRGPDTAHSLLGLPDTASPAEIEGAYWRLRGHIEARLADARDPAAGAARRAELARLHAALMATPGVDPSGIAPPLVDPRPGGSVPRWLIVWAAIASTAAALLAGWRIVEAPGDPANGSESRPVDTASIVVEADPPSATLTVTHRNDETVVVSAPADGTPRAVPPGPYRLAVVHPDCPDDWSLEADLVRGDARRYAPKICRGEGSLVVRSNATEDRLQIDGVDVGSTGATAHALRVGTHRVRVEKAGLEPWTAEVRIAPETELTLNAELRAPGEPTPERAAVAQQPPPPQPTARARPAPPPPEGPDAAATMVKDSGGGRPLPPRTGKGGSKSWHDAIVYELVSQYDRNGSGSLDTSEEIQSIPCQTWREVEVSYETGGLSVEMTHLYGFDGSEAPANTLGITSTMRGYAYDRMKSCGLKARR